MALKSVGDIARKRSNRAHEQIANDAGGAKLKRNWSLNRFLMQSRMSKHMRMENSGFLGLEGSLQLNGKRKEVEIQQQVKR